MSRSLSTVAKRAAFASQTEQVFLLLLTITHPTMPAIRVVNNTETIVSNGETFVAFPFEINLPDMHEDRQPYMQLRISNVDRQIVQAIRTLTSPPLVRVDVVVASQPDTIEATFPDFSLRSVDYDALMVEGRLTLDDILSEPYPSGSMNPQDFPGLF
jgi:hypothetical protein